MKFLIFTYVHLLPPAGHSPLLQWLSSVYSASCGSLGVSSLKRTQKQWLICSPFLAAFKVSCSLSCTVYFPNRSVMPFAKVNKHHASGFLHYQGSKLNLFSDFRWGRSMKTFFLNYVHLGREHIPSSTTQAKLM